MQPSWRNDSEVLGRDVPQGETWQTLRKGGTAGIYVVVVAISWWIKAQCSERDVNTWTLVDDVSWVIQQMKEDMTPSLFSPHKRAREADSEDENWALDRKT